LAALFLLILALPFLLRPAENELFAEASRSLVVISPHNDSIRTEFARAFARRMKERTGESVRIEWRDVGGTSEISKFVDGAFQAAFERHWRAVSKQRWADADVPSPGVVANSREVPDASPEDDSPAEAARRAFLASGVGIGVDLMFGGGVYPFAQHAKKGHLVDSGIFDAEPEWFRDEVIPSTASGEQLYDPDHRWVGSCLSSFGICYNTDWLRRRGLEPPRQWEDLGDPGYRRALAVADPTKSGSATKAYEMLLQQQLARAVESLDPELVADREQAVRDALDQGWTEGLNLIQKIAANARYFTDNAAKIPFDVAQGNAAAGMTIDFFGRTWNESLRRPDGSSRIQFVTPEAGTSIGADPIALFRGAPEPELALEFIRFVLSSEGQRLWHYRPGTPGGPARHALRRSPIRKDAYAPAEREHSSDPEVTPYERVGGFVYHEEWTGAHLGLLQFLIQVMCLDPHEELREAWDALCDAGFPPNATKMFHDVRFVGYTSATGALSEVLRDGDPLIVQKRRHDLRENFRRNYLRAAELARQGS
jgi:ABC-type Fe3+ transport system substrate-binding protein